MLPFLTARWDSLLLLNYVCPASLLERWVPSGTQLDPFEDRHLVSLVGFRFLDTRIRGIPIPFHRDFEEVNLRFYVRREADDSSVRRAVVFIRELVPRRAIATVARVVYNEPYLAVPMAHRVSLDPARGGTAEYEWRHEGRRHRMFARCSGSPTLPEAGSEAEFITEHYWGYTAQRDGGTLEYRVDHPQWRVWEPDEASLETQGIETLYGPEFASVLSQTPCSTFLAAGSDVVVYPGNAV